MPPNSNDPPNTESAGPPKKLSIALYAGTFDRVHYALVMAAATAAMGIPVTMFFTMDACRVLLKPSEDGLPSWRTMPVSEGTISGGDVAGAMDDRFGTRGVATFNELLEACVDMNVKFMVCEMGLVARDLRIVDLREDLPIEIVGFVSFLMDAQADGQMLFV